jgi:hypothetical protein
VLERDYPDVDSPYADEGTAAHMLASMILEHEYPNADMFLGKRLEIREHKTVEVDDDMARYVDEYVRYVRELAAGGTFLVEQKVSFGHAIGVDPDLAYGTADAIVIRDDVMHVIDLKYGRGVQVSPEDNEQLMLYSLGCLHEFGALADVKEVTMTIHQPRAGGVSSHTIAADALREWAAIYAVPAVWAVMKADTANDLQPWLWPTPKGCQWCKAKGSCPAVARQVQETVAVDFDDLTDKPKPELFNADYLALCMTAVDMVEDWCRAVRAETERRLLEGAAIPGWKLVEGRKGARKWGDERQAAALLEAAIPNEAYERKLISPAAAEKLLKKTPAWSAISASITQSPGAPSVAPAGDKRPAWSPTADLFEDLAEGGKR